MYQLLYSDTPYRGQLRTRCRFPIMTAKLSESHRSASWVEIWVKMLGFSPIRNLGDQLGNMSRPAFFGQPGAQQLVYIRRRSARHVRLERRVIEIFSTFARWVPLCAIGSLELGERTCTIFGVMVHLPSVLDKSVLVFRSSAARRNYGDPKTSGVEISVKNGAKLGVFAPPHL